MQHKKSAKRELAKIKDKYSAPYTSPYSSPYLSKDAATSNFYMNKIADLCIQEILDPVKGKTATPRQAPKFNRSLTRTLLKIDSTDSSIMSVSSNKSDRKINKTANYRKINTDNVIIDNLFTTALHVDECTEKNYSSRSPLKTSFNDGATRHNSGVSKQVKNVISESSAIKRKTTVRKVQTVDGKKQRHEKGQTQYNHNSATNVFSNKNAFPNIKPTSSANKKLLEKSVKIPTRTRFLKLQTPEKKTSNEKRLNTYNGINNNDINGILNLQEKHKSSLAKNETKTSNRSRSIAEAKIKKENDNLIKLIDCLLNGQILQKPPSCVLNRTCCKRPVSSDKSGSEYSQNHEVPRSNPSNFSSYDQISSSSYETENIREDTTKKQKSKEPGICTPFPRQNSIVHRLTSFWNEKLNNQRISQMNFQSSSSLNERSSNRSKQSIDTDKTADTCKRLRTAVNDRAGFSFPKKESEIKECKIPTGVNYGGFPQKQVICQKRRPSLEEEWKSESKKKIVNGKKGLKKQHPCVEDTLKSAYLAKRQGTRSPVSHKQMHKSTESGTIQNRKRKLIQSGKTKKLKTQSPIKSGPKVYLSVVRQENIETNPRRTNACDHLCVVGTPVLRENNMDSNITNCINCETRISEGKSSNILSRIHGQNTSVEDSIKDIVIGSRSKIVGTPWLEENFHDSSSKFLSPLIEKLFFDKDIIRHVSSLETLQGDNHKSFSILSFNSGSTETSSSTNNNCLTDTYYGMNDIAKLCQNLLDIECTQFGELLQMVNIPYGKNNQSISILQELQNIFPNNIWNTDKVLYETDKNRKTFCKFHKCQGISFLSTKCDNFIKNTNYNYKTKQAIDWLFPEKLNHVLECNSMDSCDYLEKVADMRTQYNQNGHLTVTPMLSVHEPNKTEDRFKNRYSTSELAEDDENDYNKTIEKQCYCIDIVYSSDSRKSNLNNNATNLKHIDGNILTGIESYLTSLKSVHIDLGNFHATEKFKRMLSVFFESYSEFTEVTVNYFTMQFDNKPFVSSFITGLDVDPSTDLKGMNKKSSNNIEKNYFKSGENIKNSPISKLKPVTCNFQENMADKLFVETKMSNGLDKIKKNQEKFPLEANLEDLQDIFLNERNRNFLQFQNIFESDTEYIESILHDSVNANSNTRYLSNNYDATENIELDILDILNYLRNTSECICKELLIYESKAADYATEKLLIAKRSISDCILRNTSWKIRNQDIYKFSYTFFVFVVFWFVIQKDFFGMSLTFPW